MTSEGSWADLVLSVPGTYEVGCLAAAVLVEITHLQLPEANRHELAYVLGKAEGFVCSSSRGSHPTSSRSCLLCCFIPARLSQEGAEGL